MAPLFQNVGDATGPLTSVDDFSRVHSIGAVCHNVRRLTGNGARGEPPTLCVSICIQWVQSQFPEGSLGKSPKKLLVYHWLILWNRTVRRWPCATIACSGGSRISQLGRRKRRRTESDYLFCSHRPLEISRILPPQKNSKSIDRGGEAVLRLVFASPSRDSKYGLKKNWVCRLGGRLPAPWIHHW